MARHDFFPSKSTAINQSVRDTLPRFLQRPGCALKCELCRERDVPHGFLSDVFDGCVWREWQYLNDKAFLAVSRNYAFMLNVDWFQPFKHSLYSGGALYMVLMNLPRSERFKLENVMLVLQFCNVEGKAYTLHRTLHSRTLVLKNQEWFDVILQLLEALKVLHNSGLIHQDIKGDNILLTYKNTLFVPVIIDFGKCIGKQEASRKVLSKQEQETYKQKYTHVAPEVVSGTHPPSHASDVYALGRLLRQVATKIGCKPLLSLSECSLKNDPNARASLDHLLVSVKTLSS